MCLWARYLESLGLRFLTYKVWTAVALYQSVRAATTKYHRLGGGLNNRNLLIVLETAGHRSGGQWGWALRRPLPLACGQLPSHRVCIVFLVSSSYKDTSLSELGPTLKKPRLNGITSLEALDKDSHALRFWGTRHQHLNFKGTIQPQTDTKFRLYRENTAIDFFFFFFWLSF